MLQGRKRMILTSIKLRLRFARVQFHTHQIHPLPLVWHTLFFLMHAQKWPLFYLKRGKKIPFLGTREKNVSPKIRQRQFCTNCRFSHRSIWLPILSSFRNDLTFWPVRWRHLMLQNMAKKSRR